MLSRVLVLFVLFMVFRPLQGQEVKEDQRPKIGLALSGGGAKGIAHIGVLRVLENACIRPDYITGTSMGSIMGGLYAIGYTVDELERMVHDIDWNYYFNDELKRTDVPIEERHLADRYQLKFAIEKNKIQFPKGFVQGQKIGLLLSYLTFPAHGVKSFDDFPIPFRCVATDAETGEKVVIKDGSLAKAMRASMSLPSIFEPMEHQGKVLLDGGVVQNLPVDEAFEMGADIVIAVDVTSPLYKRKDLVSLVQVLEQTSSYKLAEAVEQQRELADVVISPNTEGYGTLDFADVDTLLRRGEEAAEKMLQDIVQAVDERYIDQQMSISFGEVPYPKTCKVCQVRIDGVQEKRQNMIANIMQMRKDKEYSIPTIEKRIKQLFGGQFFKDAYYELIPATDGYDLMIDAGVKSGEYLQAAINYDSELKAAILLNATFRNRGITGSKFDFDVKLSENPMFAANYQVYTTAQPNFGIRFSGILNYFPLQLYNTEGSVDDVSKMTHSRISLDLFSSFNNSSMLSSGIGLERTSKRDEIFNRSTEDFGLNQSLLHLRYIFDTYDREQFPDKGTYVGLEGRMALSQWMHYPDYTYDMDMNNMTNSLRIKASRIFPMGERFAIRWHGDAGITSFDGGANANNYLSQFYLGRDIPRELSQVEFVGLDYMEQVASEYWLSGLKLRTEIFSKVYASALLNFGQYKARSYKVIDDGFTLLVPESSDYLLGMGAEVGFVTPAGPGRLGMEYNARNKSMNYVLHLGYLF